MLKNNNTDREKQVSNIRPDCSVSPETSSPKLNVEIVEDSMIKGITPVGLSSKCKHRFRIKVHAISEDLVDHIHPTLRIKAEKIAIHIGTNDIKNDDCSSLQINLSKIRKLVTELSPSTKIVQSPIILRHDKSNIKVKRGNGIIKQFCRTNKLVLIDNSNIKDQNLYGKE